MTRISSLIVASALAILPVGAFAQQTAAPAKVAEPTSLTTTAPVSDKTVTDKTVTAAPVSGTMAGDKAVTSSASTTQPVKPDAKTTAHGAKNEVHGMSGAGASHAKAGTPAKAMEPAKS